MSSVEPAVAIKNLLYSSWNITTPGKDSTAADTKDPAKVHFTNRWFAPVPLRIHTYQLSVRPLVKPYRPIQIGSITKYQNNESLALHIWVLPNPKLNIESAHTDLKAILDEVRRIIRIQGQTAGSGIQHILLGPWQDRSELDRDPPRLHMLAQATAILFEMSTS